MCSVQMPQFKMRYVYNVIFYVLPTCVYMQHHQTQNCTNYQIDLHKLPATRRKRNIQNIHLNVHIYNTIHKYYMRDFFLTHTFTRRCSLGTLQLSLFVSLFLPLLTSSLPFFIQHITNTSTTIVYIRFVSIFYINKNRNNIDFSCRYATQQTLYTCRDSIN